MTTQTLQTRPVLDTDRLFLRELFFAIRAADFSPLGHQTARLMLDLQFDAQSREYAARFNSADDRIITVGDAPVGRIWVDSRRDEWELIDIAIRPEHQGVGIASMVLGNLAGRADAAFVPLGLHVRRDNPTAQHVYFGTGFVIVESESDNVNLRLKRAACPRKTREGLTTASR